MLLSMTGYGRATHTFQDKTITIEIRSLNSKFTDLRFKLPNNYKEKEAEMRRLISDSAQRGKLDVTLEVLSASGEEDFGLNVPLFKRYVQEISAIAGELDMERGDIISSVLRIPNVISAGSNRIADDEWQAVKGTIKEALVNFRNFRAEEGKVLEADLRQRITNIAEALEKVDPYETARIDRLRQRLRQNLEEFLGKENVDENRFEQEIIFYLEKIDINEEKVRLSQHCKYFKEQLDSKATMKGRKLSFISQEIGREINTLGAKAYSSDIQKLVVSMKDELEKIKEQVANSV